MRCAKLHDAERGEEIAAVPLLARIVGAARLRAGRVFHLAKGLIVDILHEGARLIGGKARAAAFAKGKGPAARWPMPGGDEPRRRDPARHDRGGAFEALFEEGAEILVLAHVLEGVFSVSCCTWPKASYL